MRISILELRRREHEQYLRRRHGWWWSLDVESGEAIVRCGPSEMLTVRFPARELFDPAALSKRGF